MYRGRLNYLLFGRRVEKVKSWLHRITAPPVPAAKPEPEPEVQPTEDIALQRSYRYEPPLPQDADREQTGEAPAPKPTPPPAAEPEPTSPEAAPPAAEPEPASPEAAPPAAEPEPAAPEPAPPPEGDNYNEDEEYMRHMANTDEGPQPGAVDADDLLVLLSVFSKGKSATPQEIATARRAMRAISGSEIEQAILDQLNGKDGYVAVMLDMITKDLHAEDEAPLRENKKSDRAFRLEDFV